jgi:hypothetical protein
MTLSPQGAWSLHGWDRQPQRRDPLPGQQSLFPSPVSEAFTEGRYGPELFDSGRDLPGADETDQQILWDVL